VELRGRSERPDRPLTITSAHFSPDLLAGQPLDQCAHISEARADRMGAEVNHERARRRCR
jgi:hypothetical protein